METAVIVAIITASASLFSACLMFYLTKRAERHDRLQQRKVEHYTELLTAISELVWGGVDQSKAEARVSRAVNTIVLIAPQEVVQALMAFWDEIKIYNPAASHAGYIRCVNHLVLAIRRSLELPFRDDPKTFDFRLVGHEPTDADRNKTAALGLESF